MRSQIIILTTLFLLNACQCGYYHHKIKRPRPSNSEETFDTKRFLNTFQFFNSLDEQLRKTDVLGKPLSQEEFDKAIQSDTVVHQPVWPNQPVAFPERIDPIELAGLFQGDIILNGVDEYNELKFGTRSAVTDLGRRWKDATIPYVISARFSVAERTMISKAMLQFHDTTCIRFVPRQQETDYIHILKGTGCSSAVGRKGGSQIVSLASGCFILGILMHELMHSTGFWHEQSRQDRDHYIHIIWDNIQSGMEINFEKYDSSTLQTLGLGYDLSSIMHYGPYAFARDRSKPTIVPKRVRTDIGQRIRFSKRDIQKMNILYECPGKEHSCTDKDSNCEYWATFGECQKNPFWMKVNCQKSCTNCAGGKTQCRDSHHHCKTWASAGECKNNPHYMLISCRESCRSCLTRS